MSEAAEVAIARRSKRWVWVGFFVASFAVLLASDGEVPGDSSAPHTIGQTLAIGAALLAGGFWLRIWTDWHVRVMYSWSRMSDRTKTRVVRAWGASYVALGGVCVLGAIAKLVS